MQDYYTNNLSKNMHTFKHPSYHAISMLAIGCIAVLILLRDVGGMNVGRIVFIAIATIACLLMDKAGIYCLLAFLTPLAPGISATYITAIALIILLAKQPRLRFQSIGLVCMCLILFMELLSAFRGQFNIVQYLRFAGIFVFSFFCMIDLRKDYNCEKMLRYYILGFWTAMISILGQMFQVYSVEKTLSLGVRLGDTQKLLNTNVEGMVVSYNPNGLGYLCLLTSIFCLLLYQKDKKKLYLFSFFGSTILGVMTQSRSFLIVYAASIVLYTLLSCNNVKSVIKSLLALVVGGGAVASMALWLIPEYINSIFLRFQDTDLLNGRGSIASYYFQETFQHIDRFLFGVGLQNYQEKYDFAMSAHNATQEVMIAWGIIGLLIVVTLLVAVFYNGHKHNPMAKYVQYLPLLMYLVAIQSGQGFSDTSGMLRMMVAYSAILLTMKGVHVNETT